MKMTFDPAWLRCKAALESAAPAYASTAMAWLGAHRDYAARTLEPHFARSPDVAHVMLMDLIESHVALHLDKRLPDPPIWRTTDYFDWLRANRDRLRQELRDAGETNTTRWLCRRFLEESSHARTGG